MGSTDSKLPEDAVSTTVVDPTQDYTEEGDILDLSHRQLPAIPEALAKYDGDFIKVQFFNNRFKDLKPIARHKQLISPLVHCRELNVSGNFLKELPKELGLMTSLTDLDAGFNQITRVHHAVFQLPLIRSLILRHNQLSNKTPNQDPGFPEVLGDSRNTPHTLECLDLTGNQFKVMPATRMLQQMLRLRELKLASNLLEVTDGIEILAYSLQELDLSRNHIMQLPSCPFEPLSHQRHNFALTDKLERLYLHHQTEVTEEKTLMERLLADDDEEEFTELPIAVRFNVFHVTSRASNLTTLNLSSLGLTSRCFIDPDEVAKMEEDPTYQPDEPPDDCLEHLPSLTDLDLSFNQLDVFSKAIPKMNQLRRLILRNNEFQKMDGIQELTLLEELDAQYNQLVSIPVAITDWSKLSRLLLNNNNLKILPATLMHCTALRELSVGFNTLHMIPEELGTLELTNFSFHPNPKLIQPPPEIQAQGGAAMLAWMRSRVANSQIAKLDPQYRSSHQEAHLELGVEMWGSTTSFGVIEVAAKTTLGDLRELIDLRLDTAPERYLFVKDNCAIPPETEHRELAVVYEPVIQLYDQSHDHKPEIPDTKVDLEPTKELAKVLTMQLKKMKMYKQTMFTPQDGKGAQLFKMPSTIANRGPKSSRNSSRPSSKPGSSTSTPRE